MTLTVIDKQVTYNVDFGVTVPFMSPAAGASVAIRKANGGVLAQLYSASTGGTLLNNPFTLGADARIFCYVESGKYDLEVTLAGETVTYADFQAVDDIVIEGPKGTLQFADIESMKAGSAFNQQASKLNFANYLGQKVSTVTHNTRSNKGGADYIITNVNPGNLSTLVNGVWVGANHDLGGGFYAEFTNECIDMYQLGVVDHIDCSPHIQYAIDAGLPISHDDGGSFYYNQDIILASSARIIIDKRATLYRDTGVRIKAGNKDTRTSLVGIASWGIGSSLITLDASSYNNINAGDYLFIENKTPDNPSDFILDFVATPNNINDWVYQVQVVKVKEKQGSNTVLVSNAAKLNYDFSSVAKISKLDDYVEDVKISVKFENSKGTPMNSTEDVFINVSAMFDLDISGSIFNMNNESGGVFMSVGSLTTDSKTEFYDGRNLDIFLRQHCVGSKIIGSKFRNHRTNDASVFIEAHNYNVTVSNCDFNTAYWDNSSSMIAAIQLDAKVNNCSIVNNNVYAYPVGVRIELGSMQNTITGNTFQLCELSGVRMVGSRSNTVSSNTFIDCGLSDTDRTLERQQQGGIYVNGVDDTAINNNTMTWSNPSFNNFCSALSGSMDSSSFQGNTVRQAQRCVWLLGGGNNIISNNPVLDVDDSAGNDYPVVISGSGNHYNKVSNNIINGNGGANSGGVRIENGSEGNTICGNELNNVTFNIFRTGASGYQSIYENYGEGLRPTNSAITAPEMPTNATEKRGFRIYDVQFTNTSANGTKYWEFTQGTSPSARFIEFDLTSLNSVINI